MHDVLAHRLRLILLLTAFGANSIAAQASRTWIVDAAGGGQFTDLQPAFDAAAHGDTILVRSGNYGVAATGKGLRVLRADTGPSGLAPWIQTLDIVGVPAGRRFVLHGFRVFGVELRQNDGVVMISGTNIGVGGLYGTTLVDECAAVLIDECELNLSSTASHLLVTRSELGSGPEYFGYSAPAATVLGGSALFSDSVLTAGRACHFAPHPALDTASAVVRFVGHGTSVHGAHLLIPDPYTGFCGTPAGFGPAIRGAGDLLADPAVSVVGAAPSLRTHPLASVHVRAFPGALDVAVQGEPGASYVVLAGRPTSPIWFGASVPLWLELDDSLVLIGGVVGPNGSTRVRVPVAANCALPGDQILMQAVLIGDRVSLSVPDGLAWRD